MNISNRLSTLLKKLFLITSRKSQSSFTERESVNEAAAHHSDETEYFDVDPMNESLVQFIVNSEVSNRLKNAVVNANEQGLLPHRTLRDYVHHRDRAFKTYCGIPRFTGGVVFELDQLLGQRLTQLPDTTPNQLLPHELYAPNPSEVPSWSEIVQQINRHSTLDEQYIWLTAQALNLPWPTELLSMQLKNLQNLTVQQIKQCIEPYIQLDSNPTDLATLQVVLDFWDAPANQRHVEILSPENMVKRMIGNTIPHLAADILFRRWGTPSVAKASLKKIAQQLNLTRKFVHQIETKAIHTLTQLPQRNYLKILLHYHRKVIERQLLGPTGSIRQTDLKRNIVQLDPTIRVAIQCLYHSPTHYAQQHFTRFDNLYLQADTDCIELAQNFETIEKSIEDLPLPIHLDVAATNFGVPVRSLAHYTSSRKSHGIWNDYLHRGQLSPRKRRAIELVQTIADHLGGGPVTFSDICSTYRHHFPQTTCSMRDIKNSLYEYPNQFLPLHDNVFASITRVCVVPKKIPSNNVAALRLTDYKEFNPGTVHAEIANLVDEIGPAPLLEIRTEFMRRFGDRWSANSVFPVLKSSHYFIRMAPGIVGTLPMLDEPSKLTMRSALASEMQIKYFIYAKLSQSRITYPLWHPVIEHQWCQWSSKIPTGSTYSSLLTVVNPDQWQASEDEKETWRARISHEGLLALPISPVPLTRILPTIRDICALAIYIGEHPTISWIDVNQVLGYRIDSRGSFSFLAVLAKLGIVNLTDNWLLPIEVNPGTTYRFLNEMVCSNRLNSPWSEVPELIEGNPDFKSALIDDRELEKLLAMMQSVVSRSRTKLRQSELFHDQ